MFNLARKIIRLLNGASIPPRAIASSDENLPGLSCIEFDESFEVLTPGGRQYRFNKTQTATDDYLFF